VTNLEDIRVRVQGRVPEELYSGICQHYDNFTQAINDGLILLLSDKTGKLHINCHTPAQIDTSLLTAQIDILKSQLDVLVGQLETKDNQIEKQSFHIQTLISENSKLNLKLLPEKTEPKKSWWKFWQ
jgi:hypothetical protein